MSVSSVAARLARVNPLIILPATGAAAWFMAGLLLPGAGPTPAEARPAPAAAVGSRASSRAAPGNGLPERLPDRLPLTAPAATPAPAAVIAGLPGGGGGGGAASGGGDSGGGSAGTGQQRHGGASRPATSSAAHPHAPGQAGLPPHGPHRGTMPAAHPPALPVRPVTAPPARVALLAPPAPAPRVVPVPLPFPFLGGWGSHAVPHVAYGGGHFGGGRH